MTIEQAKQELVRRYKYLYENANFILAPFMREQTQNEYNEFVKKDIEKYGYSNMKEPLIYLNINVLDSINSLFEEFLLSDKKMEESFLYQMIENKKGDKEYLEEVKKGLKLLEKVNASRCYLKMTLSIWEILNKTAEYIEEQSEDIENKNYKLRVLDEYYRILRYNNTGKIYISGRKENIKDHFSSISIPLAQINPIRYNTDIGVRSNSFIRIIIQSLRYEGNYSIFTEKEKQKIYLEYHNELPCDLEITCVLEDKYEEDITDTRLCRPEDTAPCGENFIIKEEEIFVNQEDDLYRYYQLCPHCGFIVNIPKEILSDVIRERIEERCQENNKLFRKMFLYSELYSLDMLSKKEYQVLSKKISDKK